MGIKIKSVKRFKHLFNKEVSNTLFKMLYRTLVSTSKLYFVWFDNNHWNRKQHIV